MVRIGCGQFTPNMAQLIHIVVTDRFRSRVGSKATTTNVNGIEKTSALGYLACVLEL